VVQAWLVTLFFIFIEAHSVRRDARIRFLNLQVELLRQKSPATG